MNKCSYEDNLLLYMDNLLPDEEKEVFLNHFDNCEICKEQMNFFEKMEKDIPIPDDFTIKVMEKIKKPSFVSQIFPIILVTGISLFLFFSIDSRSLLPDTGNFFVKCFFLIKNLPVNHIFHAFIEQNITFLLSYTSLLFIMTVFSILWKKKNQFIIKNYLI